jgi:phosphoribosylanthranilate isomerase
MVKIAVQIYEIQEPREAEVMIALGVDRIGSVIMSHEDWKVPTIREAILVSQEAGVKHSLIPLFNTRDILFQAIDYYQPDIIHFCESLTDERGRLTPCDGLVALQKTIKEAYPDMEIMRSVPVAVPQANQSMPTLEIAKCFEGSSDYLLTDTSGVRQPVDGYIGITGITGDWIIAGKLAASSTIPVILAGGLSPENVYEAIMTVRPFGVDSCTRTNVIEESGKPVRFKKDRGRVKTFVQEVRRAQRDLRERNAS